MSAAITDTLAVHVRNELRAVAGIYGMTLKELAAKAEVRADVFDNPNVNELKALCDAIDNPAVCPSSLVKLAEQQRWSATGEFVMG